MTRTLTVFISAVGLAGAAHVVEASQQVRAWPNAPTEIQAFVRSALADRITADNIPDLDLRINRRVSIRREMTRAKMLLTEDAVPRIDGFSFSLRTTADLQAESDRTHQSPMFIIVNDATVSNRGGVIELGTDVLLPADSQAGKQCCCYGSATFRRSAGGWLFASWNNSIICF